MRLSKSLIKYLLGFVLNSRFADHGGPPQNPADYAPDAESLRLYAEASGNMEWLHLAIGHLLSDPDAGLAQFASGHTPMTEGAMRDLLEFLWVTYWPNEDVPGIGQGPMVEIADLSEAEWAAEVAAQNGA